LSAVIFMPTNKLCQEMQSDLEIGIANAKGLYSKETNDNLQFVLFGYGNHNTKTRMELLEDEVYFAEGINEKECLHFSEIVERYRENWIHKRDICRKCDKFNECRFLMHDEKAPHARIIVTTHKQYNHYFHTKILHQWHHKDGCKDRDLFIIDEDMVFSQLYRPIRLKYNEIRAFVGTITDFLQDHENTENLKDKIDRLFAHISKCDKTSIIRPIDRDFEFPDEIQKQWESTFTTQSVIIPEYLEWSMMVGNHLELIEHAIRYGVAVEKWGETFKIHFPNPRKYDLSKVPPHVFFDGTMIDSKFLEKKLLNVNFQRMRVDVKTPWTSKVFQNTNSDLPKRSLIDDKPKIQQFVSDLLNSTDKNRKIFLITTKAIQEDFLDNYLKQMFPDRHIVPGHYGNIRGINEAKDCDVGIMLGSFMPSDAVEIAMTLEFIKPENLEKDITVTKNNLWTWTDTNSVRTYNEEFSIIGKMAKTYRHSEHRQALARTRYLFHDVDFYIISKDLVSDYDPYLNKIESDPFREDLFAPRPQRPEAIVKKEEVKKAVFDWLSNHETVIPMEIHTNYEDIGRHKASEYMKEMLEEGLIVKQGKTKYRLPERQNMDRLF